MTLKKFSEKYSRVMKGALTCPCGHQETLMTPKPFKMKQGTVFVFTYTCTRCHKFYVDSEVLDYIKKEGGQPIEERESSRTNSRSA